MAQTPIVLALGVSCRCPSKVRVAIEGLNLCRFVDHREVAIRYWPFVWALPRRWWWC